MSGKSIKLIGKLFIGASLLAAAPAYAKGAETQLGQSDEAAEEKCGKSSASGEKLICRRIDNTTSRMKSFRACHTKSEWQKIERDSF
jgi:hypothetical protein